MGDFIDFCRCNVPCPCTFGQAPTDGECDGIIAWHVRERTFADVQLDGLSVVGVAHFVGNIWEPETKAQGGVILDESADEGQRQALRAILGGQAGGWPQLFGENFDQLLGWSSPRSSSRSMTISALGASASRTRPRGAPSF